MRTLFLLTLLLIASRGWCAGGQPTGSSTRGSDAAVLVAALSDFRSSGDAPEWRTKEGKATLFVNNHYETDKRFVSRKQLAFGSSTHTAPPWHVPEEARRDMEQRAGVDVVVPELQRLPNTALTEAGPQRLLTQHPDMLSYVRSYPPGYTRDGTRAFVIFFTWPNTDVYYLLEHRQKGWVVTHHFLVIFPD